MPKDTYSIVTPLIEGVNCSPAAASTIRELDAGDHVYRTVLVCELARLHSIPPSLTWRLDGPSSQQSGDTDRTVSMVRPLQYALRYFEPNKLSLSFSPNNAQCRDGGLRHLVGTPPSSSSGSHWHELIEQVAAFLSVDAPAEEPLIVDGAPRILLGGENIKSAPAALPQLLRCLRSRPAVEMTSCTELWLMHYTTTSTAATSSTAVRLLKVPVGSPPVFFVHPRALVPSCASTVTQTVYQQIAFPRAIQKTTEWIGSRLRAAIPQLPATRESWLRTIAQFSKIRLAVDINFFLERLSAGNVISNTTYKEESRTTVTIFAFKGPGKYRYIREKKGHRQPPAEHTKHRYPVYIDAPAYEIKAGALPKVPSVQQVQRIQENFAVDPAAAAMDVLKLKVHTWLKSTLLAWKTQAQKNAKRPIKVIPKKKFHDMLTDLCTVSLQVRPDDILNALIEKRVLVEEQGGRLRCCPHRCV